MRVVINRQDAFVPFVTSHWADFKKQLFQYAKERNKRTDFSHVLVVRREVRNTRQW